MLEINRTLSGPLHWEAAFFAAGAWDRGAEMGTAGKTAVPDDKGGDPMERQFFGSALCGEADVRYFLLVEEPGTAAEAESSDFTGNWNLREYGVLVEKGEEQAAIPALDCSRERVQDLLRQMVRGVVTPVTAWDVAEDWLVSR